MTARTRRSLRLATVAFVLAGASLVGTASAANAATGCGEYSFGFEGTRLLNDGISDSAGPFAISMPAGTYDITLHSFDDHAAHPGQVAQTQEQWYFTLDSGYSSPASSDIALGHPFDKPAQARGSFVRSRPEGWAGLARRAILAGRIPR